MLIKNNQGLTKIEFLLVSILILILALLVIFSLRYNKKVVRDYKRIADIRIVQTGLDNFYLSHNEYPGQNNLVLGVGQALCLDRSTGFSLTCVENVLNVVPADPSSYFYVYNVLDGGKDYRLDFYLETSATSWSTGANCALPGKIAAGSCR